MDENNNLYEDQKKPNVDYKDPVIIDELEPKRSFRKGIMISVGSEILVGILTLLVGPGGYGTNYLLATFVYAIMALIFFVSGIVYIKKQRKNFGSGILIGAVIPFFIVGGCFLVLMIGF